MRRCTPQIVAHGKHFVQRQADRLICFAIITVPARPMYRLFTELQKAWMERKVLHFSICTVGENTPQIVAHGKCFVQRHAVELRGIAIIIVPGWSGYWLVRTRPQKLYKLSDCLQALRVQSSSVRRYYMQAMHLLTQ